MVVSFKDNYEIKGSYVGVIIGWYNKYQTEWFSFPPYQLEFECDIRNHLQPYYIILIDNDIMCYVPQSMNIKRFFLFIYHIIYIFIMYYLYNV